MAALDGTAEYPQEFVRENDNPAFGQFENLFDHLASDDTDLPLFGDLTGTQPIDEVENAHDGNVLGEFGLLDFYFHIHVQYSTLNLGAVVNDISVPVYVFNGFLETVTLEDFQFVGDAGIEITAPHGAPPVDYLPLETKIYTLEVSRAGPAVITGTITFEFDVQTITIPVTGIRVLAWRWSPNWIDPLRERLMWVTDVQRTYAGTEQRRKLREIPRQAQEFTFDVDEREQRVLENTIWTWGARLWAVPFWPDVEHLHEDLPSGTYEIPVVTSSRGYTVGELLMIVKEDETYHEAMEVSEVNADSVVCVVPTTIDFPAGSLIYPARLYRLQDGPAMVRFVKEHSYGVASFLSYNGVAYTPATEATYRSFPVLTVPPVQRPDPSTQYQRQAQLVDYDVGLSELEDQSGVADVSNNFLRLAMNRDEIHELRQHLYARMGRFKGLWVPSFASDLKLAAPVTDVATTMNFEFAGLVDLAEGRIHRRDIRIELTTGAVIYRRLSAPTKVTDDVERMTLDTPLGTNISSANVKIISWMAFSRLDSDEIEIAWTAPHVAESNLIYRSYKNDV